MLVILNSQEYVKRMYHQILIHSIFRNIYNFEFDHISLNQEVKREKEE